MSQSAVPEDDSFVQELLREMLDRATPPDPDAVIPWRIEETPEGLFAVLPVGESLAGGAEPLAETRELRMARLIVVGLLVRDLESRYTLGEEREEEGYPVLCEGEVVGHLTERDEAALEAINLADALARTPAALALLCEIAGGETLEAAGLMALIG
jgi:hypothetical protein